MVNIKVFKNMTMTTAMSSSIKDNTEMKHKLSSKNSDKIQKNNSSLSFIKKSLTSKFKKQENLWKKSLEENYLKEENLIIKNKELKDNVEEIDLKRREIEEENIALQKLIESTEEKDKIETEYNKGLKEQLFESEEWRNKLEIRNEELKEEHEFLKIEDLKRQKEILEIDFEELNKEIIKEDEKLEKFCIDINKADDLLKEGKDVQKKFTEEMRQKSWLEKFCGKTTSELNYFYD